MTTKADDTMKEVSDHIIRIAVSNTSTKEYARSLASTIANWVSKHWFIYIVVCIAAPYVAFTLVAFAYFIIRNEIEEMDEEILELDNQKETVGATEPKK